jgi:hypothetical protein
VGLQGNLQVRIVCCLYFPILVVVLTISFTRGEGDPGSRGCLPVKGAILSTTPEVHEGATESLQEVLLAPEDGKDHARLMLWLTL